MYQLLCGATDRTFGDDCEEYHIVGVDKDTKIIQTNFGRANDVDHLRGRLFNKERWIACEPDTGSCELCYEPNTRIYSLSNNYAKFCASCAGALNGEVIYIPDCLSMFDINCEDTHTNEMVYSRNTIVSSCENSMVFVFKASYYGEVGGDIHDSAYYTTGVSTFVCKIHYEATDLINIYLMPRLFRTLILLRSMFIEDIVNIISKMLIESASADIVYY